MSPPSLKIELAPSIGSAHIVTSDQIIPGKVIFTNKQDRPEGVVSVSLVGRSHAKIKEGSRLYTGTATLFQLSNTLHEGHLSEGEHEWAFEFIFPKATSGEEKAWSASSPYKVSEGHQLPPSMTFDSVQALAEGEGSVSYKIEAKFLKSPKPSLFSSSESASLDLYYLPFRQFDEPDPRIYFMGRRQFTCKSDLLEPKASGKSKSFFKRSKTPVAAFQLALNVPEVVYVGGPLPIYIGLSHDLANSTAPESPTVMMTSCAVAIIRTVHARGKLLKMEGNHELSTREVLMTQDNLEIPLAGVQNLSELIDLPVVGTQFGLSFATYNIVQTCKLEVKFKLKCVDKTFSGELDSQRFIVLSPLTKEAVEKNGNPASILQDIGQQNKGAAITMNTAFKLLGIATKIVMPG
jgi:hypothetical protein